MPPVPVLKPREVVNTFKTATLSVPNHSEIARGTLRSLIVRAGITLDEFLEALNRQFRPNIMLGKPVIKDEIKAPEDNGVRK